MTDDDRVEELKRKLRETESRVVARFLKISRDILPNEYYNQLEEELHKNQSYDALELERQIADDARERSDMLEQLLRKVEQFQRAKRRFDEESAMAHFFGDTNGNPQKTYHEMLLRREEMFSLVNEIAIKDNIPPQ